MSSKIFSVNFNSFYLWIPLIFLLIFFNGINSSQTDCDDESCLECEDSIPSSCLLCNSSYFLDTMNHSCVEECNNHLVKEIKNISETLNKTCINCKDFNKIKIINKDEECYENDTNNTYGYFLSDSETNFYEPCYDTCASCVGFGNETKQNCLSCRNISEIPNEETNCVEKCFYTCENCTTHGDESNHRCTQCKESKLEEYSKNSYFNCIDECPPYLGTYREEGKCKNCKTMDLFKYLKDEQCINKTEGVYIINNYTENGTTINITGYNIIEDCYESCRICNQSGSNDTNNCL
ncbi:MAG: hypothetical protein MJ252_18470, partial [archaeon]|nr:hypothetical protein [archaeon]